MIERYCSLKAESIIAWRNPQDGLIYVHGTEESLDETVRWLEPLNQPLGPATNTVIAELTLETANPGDDRDKPAIIWHSRFPVRAWNRRYQLRPDERSGVKLHRHSNGADGEKEETAWCDIELRAIFNEPPAGRRDADPPDRWDLTAAVSLNPPLVATHITLPELDEKGGPDGAVLRRVVGKSSDGKDVILTIQLRSSPLKTSWLWRPPPDLLWWWRERVGSVSGR